MYIWRKRRRGMVAAGYRVSFMNAIKLLFVISV